jgi:hypothetical protein
LIAGPHAPTEEPGDRRVRQYDVGARWCSAIIAGYEMSGEATVAPDEA